MSLMIPGLQAFGTVLSAVGMLRQGNAAYAAGNYNAQIAQENAGIAIEQSQADAVQVARAKTLALGAMRANISASGGQVSGGTFLDVIGDTATQYELQKQQTLYQGKLAARGYTNTANMDIYQGKEARTAGRLAAAGALLQGGAQTAGSFQRLG